MTLFLMQWHWQWACGRLSAFLVSFFSDVRGRDHPERCWMIWTQAHWTRSRVGPWLCCSCMGQHTEPRALRSLQLFSLAAFLWSQHLEMFTPRSVFVFISSVHHTRGECVCVCVCFCVGSGKLERIWHEFPKQTKGWWSLINDLLDGTLTHSNSLGGNGDNKRDQCKSVTTWTPHACNKTPWICVQPNKLLQQNNQCFGEPFVPAWARRFN